MKTTNITVSLDEAKEWYKSGNKELRELALKAFSKFDLEEYSFKSITSFKRACDALGLSCENISTVANRIKAYSKASAAMFKLNIIRKALNLGQDLHLTKDPEDSSIYYPHNPFVTTNSTYYESEIKLGIMEVIGKIKSEGEVYYVLSDCTSNGGAVGLGLFYSGLNIGQAYANVGFLGCASKEIAQHFGKYFGMLITEAKYGDLLDFEIL